MIMLRHKQNFMRIILMMMMRTLDPGAVGYLGPSSWEFSLFSLLSDFSVVVYAYQLNLALTVG